VSREPTVETASGRVAGTRSADGLEFLGLPYAGADRFAPPTLVPAWSGVRAATRPGPAAPQPARAVASFTHGDLPEAGTDEQCLNLNVYTPALGGARPVMMWIHGGGFAIGHGAASLYRGGALAASADVVVVSLNYRLGSLGWLSHPDLGDGAGGPAGNWGLLDQIAALEWVRNNIAGFGGDPGRITVAGQSAGALCAIDLLAAPAAAGLFKALCAQSPPLGDLAQPPEVAHDWAEALSRLAGGRGGFDLGLLRSLPAERIVVLQEELLGRPEYRGTRGGALPTLDPGTLPASPLDVPGAAPAVDVLTGHTADEGTFFFNSPWRPAPPPERIPEVIAHLAGGEDPAELLGRRRAAARAEGRSEDPALLLAEIATEAMFVAPLRRWARARAEAVALSGGPSRCRAGAPRHPYRRGAAAVRDVGRWGPGRAAGWPGARGRRGRRASDACLGRVPVRARTGLGAALRRDGGAGGGRVRRPGRAGLCVGVGPANTTLTCALPMGLDTTMESVYSCARASPAPP
jgi:para-nitrobenzyl esterase